MPVIHHYCPYCDFPILRASVKTCGRPECMLKQNQEKAAEMSKLPRIHAYACLVCKRAVHRKDTQTCGGAACLKELRRRKKAQTQLDIPGTDQADQLKDNLPTMQSFSKVPDVDANTPTIPDIEYEEPTFISKLKGEK